MKRVLVYCKKASVRGPIVSGWLNYYCGDDAEITVAAIDNSNIDPVVAQSMTDAVIDITGFKAVPFENVIDKKFDFIIKVFEGDNDINLTLPGNPKIIVSGFEDISTFTGDDKGRVLFITNLRDEIEDFCFDFVNENIKQLIPDDLISFGTKQE